MSHSASFIGERSDAGCCKVPSIFAEARGSRLVVATVCGQLLLPSQEAAYKAVIKSIEDGKSMLGNQGLRG